MTATIGSIKAASNMPPEDAWMIRPVDAQDADRILSIIHGAKWKHQHLDWLDVLDLLDQKPFMIALSGGKPMGALACPPDPPGVCWLRFFAAAHDVKPGALWDKLWPGASAAAAADGIETACVLLLSRWLTPFLVRSGFAETNAVVFLEWRTGPFPVLAPIQGTLRPMLTSDLHAVAEIDRRAFDGIWRISNASISAAMRQGAYATVIEAEGRMAAYQISTASALGAHLARLAVDPASQGQGLATALVGDVLREFVRRGQDRLTVNTQEDNGRSRRLYRRLGFRETGDIFPVYQIDLTGPSPKH